MADLEPLKPADFDKLWEFWQATHPDLSISGTLLVERLFGPPDATAENCFCMRGEDEELTAVLFLAPPVPGRESGGDHLAGIRWMSVHPDHRGRGVGHFLMNFACDRLQSEGATAVDFLTTPPFYLRPGVDIRNTEVIAWLLQHGFHHERTLFNMTVDLRTYEPPSEAMIHARDDAGYSVRRATEEDRIAFAKYCMHEWTVNWAREAAQGLEHDPESLFLAVKHLTAHPDPAEGNGQPGADEIVGFAAYETSQLHGSFGPAGVSPEHRGRDLGKKLLWATLADMKKLGRQQCEIGWVGPVDFYYRSAGATLGPVFWQMRRRLL